MKKLINSKILRDRALSIGLFLFLILISIGNLTTNESSRVFIIMIRYLTLFGISFSLLILVSLKRLNKNQTIALILYFSLILYGSFTSIINGAFEIGQINLQINILVTVIGIILMASHDSQSAYNSLVKPYAIYVLLGLFATLIVGGIEITFPPRFVFSYAEESTGNDITYSQGASQFFGLGAIAALFTMNETMNIFKKFILTLILLVFISLSLLGGARGDSMGAILVILIYLTYNLNWRIFLLILIFAIIFFLFTEEINNSLENFVIFNRLSTINSNDFGERDLLLDQVTQLLIKEPSCLMIGCGFGFFQNYYGYEFGMYPHNFVAESLIVFGLPISMIFGILVVKGLLKYHKECKKVNFFSLLFIYSAIVNLKSGSLFGGWLLTASSFYFASLYLNRNIFTRHYP